MQIQMTSKIYPGISFSKYTSVTNFHENPFGLTQICTKLWKNYDIQKHKATLSDEEPMSNK